MRYCRCRWPRPSVVPTGVCSAAYCRCRSPRSSWHAPPYDPRTATTGRPLSRGHLAAEAAGLLGCAAFGQVTGEQTHVGMMAQPQQRWPEPAPCLGEGKIADGRDAHQGANGCGTHPVWCHRCPTL